MPTPSRFPTKKLAVNFLQLFGLCSFAFAQPFYSLMANYIEFFVGYRTQALDLFLFVGCLSLLPPLLLTALEALIGLAFGQKALRVVHGQVMSILLFMTLVTFLNKVNSLSAVKIILIAIVLTGIVVMLFIKQKKLRDYPVYLAFAGLIFPLNFIFFTPVKKILAKEKKEQAAVLQGKSSPTFVIVMFDEFRPDTLMDGNMMIDRERFPNFAEFLNDAVWYRRATTESSATVWAMPALLTGMQPKDRDKMPISKDYPNNLFTLLAKDYRLNVHEHITMMCPPELNEVKSKDDNRAHRLKGLLLDSSLIYMHIIVPKDFEDKLPSVSHTVKGFFDGGSGQDASRSEFNEIYSSTVKNAYRNQRYDEVQNFVQSLKKTERPAINFLHVELPHCFFDYLPSGQFYSPERTMDGWLRRQNTWVDDATLSDLAYQRHMLQVGFTDKMFGDIVQRLKQIGLYDECFLILTADHGASFRPNDAFRPITKTNYPDIVGVPLFIKFPFKKETGVRDVYAHLSDVMPTLVEILGIQPPWAMDGKSLLGKDFPARDVMNFFDPDTKSWMKFNYKDACAFPCLPEKVRKFGEHVPLDETFYHTQHADLVGKAAKDLKCVEDAGLTSIIYNNEEYKHVDRASNYLPAYMHGKVSTAPGDNTIKDLAILVNGVVRAVTRTTNMIGNGGEYRAIVPYKYLQQGSNDVAVALIGQDQDGGKYLTLSPQRGNYRVMNAQYMLKNASHATVAWTGHPEWSRIKIEGEYLQLAPYDLDEGEITTLRVKAAPGSYQVSGLLRLPEQPMFPVVLRISVIDAAGKKTPVYTQEVVPGSRIPMTSSFDINQDNCELSFECAMDEAAKNNWSATLNLEDFKVVSFEKSKTESQAAGQAAVTNIKFTTVDVTSMTAKTSTPVTPVGGAVIPLKNGAVKSVMTGNTITTEPQTWVASEMLAKAAYANAAWPGQPGWSYINAAEDLLQLTPRNVGESDVTTLKLPLAAGQYQLTGNASLGKQCTFPVALIIAVAPRGADGKEIQRITFKPGETQAVHCPLSIAAGDSLVLQCALAPGAENNWNAMIEIKSIRLQPVK